MYNIYINDNKINCMDLIIGFQDIEFLPSRVSFYNTLLKNSGRDESLGTVTRHTTVVGGKQGHTPWRKTFTPTHPLFV